MTRARWVEAIAWTPAPPRWVACSAREFGTVGEVAHLVAPGGLSTVCGASASHADVWRRNTTKPRCTRCETLAPAVVGR